MSKRDRDEGEPTEAEEGCHASAKRAARIVRQGLKLKGWETRKEDERKEMESYAVWLSLKEVEEKTLFEEWRKTWGEWSERRIEHGIWLSMQELAMTRDFERWVSLRNEGFYDEVVRVSLANVNTSFMIHEQFV